MDEQLIRSPTSSKVQKLQSTFYTRKGWGQLNGERKPQTKIILKSRLRILRQAGRERCGTKWVDGLRLEKVHSKPTLTQSSHSKYNAWGYFSSKAFFSFFRLVLLRVWESDPSHDQHCTPLACGTEPEAVLYQVMVISFSTGEHAWVSEWVMRA